MGLLPPQHALVTGQMTPTWVLRLGQHQVDISIRWTANCPSCDKCGWLWPGHMPMQNCVGLGGGFRQGPGCAHTRGAPLASPNNF